MLVVMGPKSGGKLLNWGREPSGLAGLELGERLEIRRGSSAGGLGTGAGVVGIAVVVGIVVVLGIVVVVGLAVVVGLVVVVTTCGGGTT